MSDPAASPPLGRSYAQTREYGVWVVLGVFAVGAVLGTAAALLYAPKSGAGMRKGLARRVQKLTGREKGNWKRLRRTLRKAAELKKPDAPAVKAIADG